MFQLIMVNLTATIQIVLRPIKNSMHGNCMFTKSLCIRQHSISRVGLQWDNVFTYYPSPPEFKKQIYSTIAEQAKRRICNLACQKKNTNKKTSFSPSLNWSFFPEKSAKRIQIKFPSQWTSSMPDWTDQDLLIVFFNHIPVKETHYYRNPNIKTYIAYFYQTLFTLIFLLESACLFTLRSSWTLFCYMYWKPVCLSLLQDHLSSFMF